MMALLVKSWREEDEEERLHYAPARRRGWRFKYNFNEFLGTLSGCIMGLLICVGSRRQKHLPD